MIVRLLFILLSLSLSSCKEVLYIDDEIVHNEPDSTIIANNISFQLDKQSPITHYVHNQNIVYDFGKDAFSQIEVTVNSTGADSIIIYYGECMKDYLIDMHPGGSRRCGRISIPLLDGTHTDLF